MEILGNQLTHMALLLLAHRPQQDGMLRDPAGGQEHLAGWIELWILSSLSAPRGGSSLFWALVSLCAIRGRVRIGLRALRILSPMVWRAGT